MCGGVGETKKGDQEAQQIIDSVRADLESKSGKSFSKYEAHSYSTQVVAGTNFFVKVQVSSSDFLHLRVFRPLPHTGEGPELTAFQENKSENDAIEYF